MYISKPGSEAYFNNQTVLSMIKIQPFVMQSLNNLQEGFRAYLNLRTFRPPLHKSIPDFVQMLYIRALLQFNLVIQTEVLPTSFLSYRV